MADKDLNLFTFVQGTCEFMCPEKEMKLPDMRSWLEGMVIQCHMVPVSRREKEGLLHVLEMKPGTERDRLPRADPSRTVKCFARSAAGQERQAASDLRPPHVLHKTLHYLLRKVIADSRCDWHVMYEFVFDRLRAIRQDMIIQGVCPKVSIKLLQPMVRFHAYTGYRLCEEPLAKFDPQINRTHLLECLKTLLSLYDDEDTADVCVCSACAVSERTCQGDSLCSECTIKLDSGTDSSCKNSSVCDARAEMEALYVALNLGSTTAISRSLEIDLQYSRDPVLGAVVKMSLSHWLGHYVHVYRNLTSLPPLVLCVAVLHLPAIRRQTLQIMSMAFSSRNLGFPLHKLANLLLYSSDREAANDCRRFNLVVKEDSVVFDKKAFNATVSLSPLQHEPFVEKKLRECDLPTLLLGT